MPDATASEPAGDGIELLKAKVERRSRAVPPPRNPRPVPAADADPGDGAALPEAPGVLGEEGTVAARAGDRPAASPVPAVTPARSTAASTGRAPQPARYATATATATHNRPATQPDEPLANLAVRVRRSLDARLADLIHSLRQDGVRTTKVELVELILWELPAEPSPELRSPLADFRVHAPREEPL